MKRISLTFALTFLTTISAFADIQSDQYYNEVRDLTLRGHNPLRDYTQARLELMQKMFLKKDKDGYYIQDVYCAIKFRHSVGPQKIPSDRDVNIEHTWPQSKFNKRVDKAIQKSDLHHLFPSDSKANGKRGNMPFGEFNHGEYATDYCEISQVGTIEQTHNDGFEPPEYHKGNVARALFYFSIRYDLRINDYEEMVLRQWNLIDPVDAEEIARNNHIQSVQGNRNPFIDEPELADLISNF